MISVSEMKKLLSEEYGINSAKELREALESTSKIDIGLFVSEQKRSETESNINTDRATA